MRSKAFPPHYLTIHLFFCSSECCFKVMFFFLKNDLRLENFGSKLPCSHFLQKRMKYFVTKFKTISCTKSEWSPLKLVDFCWTAGRIRPLQFITFFFNFLFLLFFHNLRSFWYFSELCGPVVKAIGFRLIVSSNPYLAIFFFPKGTKKVMNWRGRIL